MKSIKFEEKISYSAQDFNLATLYYLYRLNLTKNGRNKGKEFFRNFIANHTLNDDVVLNVG